MRGNIKKKIESGFSPKKICTNLVLKFGKHIVFRYRMTTCYMIAVS